MMAGSDSDESSDLRSDCSFQAIEQSCISRTKKREACDSDSVKNQRPRGRPLGSKNKPKAPPTGIREISNALKSHALEVPSGCDVVKTLETFIRTCQLGVFVIRGTGMVTNVTLQDPAVPGGSLLHSGIFQIVSFSGAFPRRAESQEAATGLKVCLTDAKGKIVGGKVIGRMIAYGLVIVVVGTAIDIPGGRTLPAASGSDSTPSRHLQQAQP